jgi:hypothetical protein
LTNGGLSLLCNSTRCRCTCRVTGTRRIYQLLTPCHGGFGGRFKLIVVQDFLFRISFILMHTVTTHLAELACQLVRDDFTSRRCGRARAPARVASRAWALSPHLAMRVARCYVPFDCPVAVDNTVPAFHIIHFARSNPTRAGHGLFWADPCSAQQQRQRGRAGKRKAVK